MNKFFRFATIGLQAGTLSLGSISAVQAQSEFTGLGFLPDGTYSYARDVSADGSVVVGYSGSPEGPQAFRWASAAGMAGLGFLAGDNESIAFGVSADGTVVVGNSDYWPPAEITEGFRWTAAAGVESLGVSPSSALAVSADGSVVVGSTLPSFGTAFYWTATDGLVNLGYLPGDDLSYALDVSADGSVIVGHSGSQEGARGFQAFRWTQAGGMVGLGFLLGDNGSRAFGVSADGSVVVGESRSQDSISSAGIPQAFRWTQSSGMVGLGLLPGTTFSSASDVSADGAVVVGGSGISPSLLGEGNIAFIWDALHGLQSLPEVLTTEFGLDLTGWTLWKAIAISADGRAIVGDGTNPQGQSEAWLVRLSAITLIDRWLTGLVSAEALRQYEADALADKMHSAQILHKRGQQKAACNRVEKFIKQVNTYLDFQRLTPEQGPPLIHYAESYQREIGCQTETPVEQCDLNGNGRFDLRDIVRFYHACHIGKAYRLCDYDDNGRFNLRDMALFVKQCAATTDLKAERLVRQLLRRE